MCFTGDMWKSVFIDSEHSLSHAEFTLFGFRFHRTMTRPYFSRDRIAHFEMFDRHAGTSSAGLSSSIIVGR